MDNNLTREYLWRQCAEFAIRMLPADATDKTINQVTVKIYEAMEFLIPNPI